MSTMKTIPDLIKDIIGCLVEDPSKIDIEEKSGQRTTVINIIAPKEEIGKIIGKEGKIITAIRAIAENIAAKNDKRINIHIID